MSSVTADNASATVSQNGSDNTSDIDQARFTVFSGQADDQIASDDQRQPRGPLGRDAVVQQQRGQQRGPERQAARQQNRSMRGRRIEEAAVREQCIAQPAESTGHGRHHPGGRG